MKKRNAIIGLLLCVSLFMMGCQQTPDEKAVVQKNTSALMAKEESNTATIKDYPESYSDSSESEAVTCKYETKLHTYSAEKLPVYHVAYDTFSQEQATSFLDKTLDGRELYEMPEEWTKEEYDAAIKELKRQIESMNCGEQTFDGMHTYNEMVEKYKKEYQSAPEPTHEKAALEFVKGSDGGERIFGYTMNEDGSKRIVQVSNNDYINDPSHPTHMGYIDLYNNVFSYVDYSGIYGDQNNIVKDNLQLSPEDALKQAEELLKKYGIEDFYSDGDIRLVGSGDPASMVNTDLTKEHHVSCGYSLCFTRKQNGIQFSTPESACDIIQPFRTEVQSKEEREAAEDLDNDMEYAPTKDCECISMVVNDNGVIVFDYSAPYKIEEEVIDDAHILPVEELFKAMDTQFSVSYSGDDGKTVNTITDLTLNYQRIDEENSDSTSLLIPVWMAKGNLDSEYEDDEEAGKIVKMNLKNKVFFTINAIDGSQIATSNLLG